MYLRLVFPAGIRAIEPEQGTLLVGDAAAFRNAGRPKMNRLNSARGAAASCAATDLRNPGFGGKARR